MCARRDVDSSSRDRVASRQIADCDSMEYYRVYRVLCMGPGSAQSSTKRQASRCEIQSAALGVVLSGITINIDQYIILDHGYGSPV